MFAEIRQSLHEFGVDFDVYFNEKTCTSPRSERARGPAARAGADVRGGRRDLVAHHRLRRRQGPVVVKSDGSWTYISGDLAYYLDKRERGFDRVVHHARRRPPRVRRPDDGHAPASATPGTNLEILIGQMVNLVRGGEPLRMSKRAGTWSRWRTWSTPWAWTPAGTRWRACRPTRMIDIDLDSARQAHPTTTRSSTCSTRTPARATWPALAPRPGLRARATASTPRCSPRDRVDLLGALGEFPGVVARAAELREPHRVARYLEELAGAYHRLYDDLPGAPLGADEQVTDLHRTRLWLNEATRTCWPAGSPCSGSPRRSACSVRAHEAGALHAEGYAAPAWLRRRQDVNALVPQLWPRPCGAGTTACCRSAAWRVDASPPSSARRRTCWTRADFRSRARNFADAFDAAFADLLRGADVYYAGKAFLCTEVARRVVEEGLFLDVCTGGELAVAMAAGFRRRGSACTATTSGTPSSPAPSTSASGGPTRLLHEIAGSPSRGRPRR